MLFDIYVQQSEAFIREVAEELENRDDVNRAFRVTRNVLHTVRDVLTPEESPHLIAQLPMIIKRDLC